MKFSIVGKLFSIVILFSFSLNTFSTDICTDPIEAVCTDTKKARDERKLKIKRLKEEIVEEAQRRIDAGEFQAQQRGSSSRFGSVGAFFNRISGWLDQYAVKNRAIMTVAAERVSHFESNILSENLKNRIRNYLIQAIDESDLSAEYKEKFKEKIRNVVIGTFEDYQNRSGIKNSFFAQMFMNHCGSDGLVDNAFATKSGNDDYVLICPGWLISLNDAKTEQEVFGTVLQVLTHELSHHIDSRDFPDAYNGFRSCYINNHFDDLALGEHADLCSTGPKTIVVPGNTCEIDIYEEHISDIDENTSDLRELPNYILGEGAREIESRSTERLETAEEVTARLELCRINVVNEHLGEIVADTWGAQVVAKYISENASDGPELTARGMMKLCESKDEGVHPGGHFRIQEILLGAPEIRDALSCEARSNSQYCAL